MKKLLQLFLLLGSTIAFSQGTISGTIADSDLGGPLPGANVIETGTSNGTVTDFDGNFILNVSSNTGFVEVTYLGFTKRTLPFTLKEGNLNLGNIQLTGDANTLAEIVIIGTGVIDLAEDRKTPVAVSTIKAQEIQSKTAGNREFTEALKNTPSVYVANQAGGFGDSQIFLRGFDDTNTAFLLNGQPINSVEDGRMFWSNWAGMADVANAVQIQRGLGSSKLAISSVGGTVNILSKTTDKKEGGFVRFLAGNDSFFKGTVSYDTGVSDKGWAFSALVDHWQADRKYSFGTAGQGQNYLFSVGYKPNENHSFNFLITGAPQWHDQNFSTSLENYDVYGEKYNPNTGFLDGTRFSERRNYYHKPVANLNWDFNINEKTDLSTVLYASWGRGGGTGPLGSSGNRVVNRATGERDWEQIRANNIATSDNGIGNFGDSYILRASVNNHNWYGMLSNLNFEANENWSFNVGYDARLYRGDHWRQVNNLLGLTGFNDNFGTDRPDNYLFTNEFEANPWTALFDFADEENRTQYDYSENINYIGGFGQIEYSLNNFSAFVQGAFSSQSFQREGRFVGSGDGLGKSEKLSRTGYNIKGGLAYSIDDNHTFFGNAGTFSRQPFLDNIFADIRNSNTVVSPEVENEEILGFEAGYRFKNDNLRVNVDVYRTQWGNRFLAFGGTIIENDIEVFVTNRLTDVTQIHQGLEFDLEYRPDYGNLKFRAFGSIGNWKYDGETPLTVQNDETLEFIVTDATLNLTGTKVGNAPQTSFGAGLSLKLVDGLFVDADFNIFDNLFGFVDPEDVAVSSQEGSTFQAERLPAYTLTDAGITYNFKLGNQKITFRGNVYNLFNQSYINQRDAFGYFLGIGRTYNASLRLDF